MKNLKIEVIEHIPQKYGAELEVNISFPIYNEAHEIHRHLSLFLSNHAMFRHDKYTLSRMLQLKDRENNPLGYEATFGIETSGLISFNEDYDTLTVSLASLRASSEEVSEIREMTVNVANHIQSLSPDTNVELLSKLPFDKICIVYGIIMAIFKMNTDMSNDAYSQIIPMI